MNKHYAGFPRQEILDKLVEGKTYREQAGWRLFREINNDGSTGHMQILITLGDSWTLLDGDEFRRLAERILPQL